MAFPPAPAAPTAAIPPATTPPQPTPPTAPSAPASPSLGPVGQVSPAGMPPMPNYYQSPPAPTTPAVPQTPGTPAAPGTPGTPDPYQMIQQMHQQQQMMVDMNRSLMAQLNSSASPVTPAEPAPEYQPFTFAPEVQFTDQDRNDMGKLDGAVTRKIQHETLSFLQPVLDQINAMGQQLFEANNKFGTVESQIADTQSSIYSTALMTTVPNLNSIIQDPNFKQFAAQTVPHTNKSLFDILQEAHRNRDVAGVRRIVDSYQQSLQQPAGQMPGQTLPVHTQTTGNPGLFAQPQTPVQAPPMQNYAQPYVAPGQHHAAPQPSGNQQLIQQQYEEATTRYRNEKTPEARQVWEAASAKMFEMQMGLVQ